MNHIREILGNAKIAYINMDIGVNCKKIIDSIFDLLEENKENIEKANKIDVKNNNGFKLDFEMINKIKAEITNLEDEYRKVIYMHKNQNNYLEGKQTDNLGTICLVYDGNTYYLIELVLKAILTHNSIVIVSESDYMKATNELIVILIQRILKVYNIDKNLVQILYTTELEHLLSNYASINKVIVVGNREFQDRIKRISKIEVISSGYNSFDLYIEDLSHLSFIKQIIEKEKNIDLYVKSNLEVPFEDYIEVGDIDEAIAQINFNTSGYSTSIFTDSGINGFKFLREVKSKNISVNSSPLIKSVDNIDINLFLSVKNMIYPSPLAEEKKENSFTFPTVKAILEKNKISEEKKENQNLKEELKRNLEDNKKKIEEKQKEVDELRRQLNESQSLANKYMSIFRKSFFSRLFGKVKKHDLDDDTKMLS